MTNSGESDGGLTRRGFLRQLGAFIGALAASTALGVLRAPPASAAWITVPPLGKVTCSQCTSCHHCGCNCSYDPCPAGDWWYVRYNASGSNQTCWNNGASFPCHGETGWHCTGSPPSWSLYAYTKCCCCV
jgi:hypothetical protein